MCRHPASGYVQGINDLVTPFLAVFLSPHMEGVVGDETEADFPEEVCSCYLTTEPAALPSTDVQQAHGALRAQHRWQGTCRACLHPCITQPCCPLRRPQGDIKRRVETMESVVQASCVAS